MYKNNSSVSQEFQNCCNYIQPSLPLHLFRIGNVYRHWEYHWPFATQVDPDAHVVGPVHPWPPHCPYLGEVPPPLLFPAAEVVGCCPARLVVVLAAEVVVGLLLEGTWPFRTHPVFEVKADGQVTSLNVMFGLSAFLNLRIRGVSNCQLRRGCDHSETWSKFDKIRGSWLADHTYQSNRQ